MKDEHETPNISHKPPGVNIYIIINYSTNGITDTDDAMSAGERTCPQALQWCRLLVMELNGS